MKLYNKLRPYMQGFLIGMLVEYCIRVQTTPLQIFILATIILGVIIDLNKK